MALDCSKINDNYKKIIKCVTPGSHNTKDYQKLQQNERLQAEIDREIKLSRKLKSCLEQTCTWLNCEYKLNILKGKRINFVVSSEKVFARHKKEIEKVLKEIEMEE